MADKCSGMIGQVFHAGFVAKNTAPRSCTAGIDGQHSHLLSLIDEVHAKGFDKGALANARNPGNANPYRLAGIGRHFSIISWAFSWSLGRVLSIKVMALLKIVLLPSLMPFKKPSAESADFRSDLKRFSASLLI